MNASGPHMTETHDQPWPDLTEEAAVTRKDTTQP